MTENKLILRGHIFYGLARKRKWGHSHTSIENLKKGAPSHLRGDVDKEAHKLIKEGFLCQKPTSYGLEVSLETARKGEIEDLIEKYLKAIDRSETLD